jgi:thiol-disulfide isomerase/thioredoxin
LQLRNSITDMALKTRLAWITIIASGVLLGFHAKSADAPTTLRKAPQFALRDLERQVHRLDDFSGKVVVVNFWASWCVPCRQELPSMNRASRALPSELVVWLAINVGEDREAVVAFRNDYPMAFTVLLDTDGRVSKDWQIAGMPTTFVINPEGEIAHQILGKRDWNDAAHLQLVRQLIDSNQ